MNMDEEDELDFEGEASYWEDEFNSLANPQSDHERIELLRIALNFPKAPGASDPYQCCTPSDLDELEGILKRHLRK